MKRVQSTGRNREASLLLSNYVFLKPAESISPLRVTGWDPPLEEENQ